MITPMMMKTLSAFDLLNLESPEWHEGDEDKELDPDDGVKVNIETFSCFCSGGVVIGVFQNAKRVIAPI